jgi:hypothetical protein
LLGIGLMAASLPASRFTMSVAGLLLFGNWLVEGNLVIKLKSFFNNTPALVFSCIFALHVLGLLFTSDFSYALKDLRTKVPLLVLPLIFTTMPALTSKQFRAIILVYVGAVVAASFVSSYFFFQQNYNDIREISPYISHIRLSLNVCMALVFLLYYVRYPERSFNIPRWLPVLMMLWLTVFIYLLDSLTGIIIFLVLSLSLLIRFCLVLRQKWLKYSLLLVVVLTPLVMIFTAYSSMRNCIKPEIVDYSKLGKFTPRMNAYNHDSTNRQIVNGHYVWIYVSDVELEKEWIKRSTLPFKTPNAKGLVMCDVLIRYMTSLGYRKDQDGMRLMTDEDIRNVENGVTDIRLIHENALMRRLREVLFEYQNYVNTGDPSGHSVMMRLEYWKASLGIIRNHWLTGVGTGDMNQAFERQYDEMKSLLKPEWRRRSHNQFLSVTVGFGIFGLLVFLFALIYPPIRMKKLFTYRFGLFFLVLMLSMLTEDTIESQDGVTFAAFFYAYLLFAANPEKPIFVEENKTD